MWNVNMNESCGWSAGEHPKVEAEPHFHELEPPGPVVASPQRTQVFSLSPFGGASTWRCSPSSQLD